MKLHLISVNVGMPGIIGTYRGEAVVSGIVKMPVAHPSVFVGANNIEGDGQADLSAHGGIDKAVYCYPADHWPWWEREHAFSCRPAAFGENLTVEGADERAIAIGDRFRWDEVLLEVSQPRSPCFKFAIFSERPDAPSLMTDSGRSGWYFRVVREGRASVGSCLMREERSGGPTVREAFLAALDAGTPQDSLIRVAAAPGLSAAWRKMIAKRLDS